MKSQHPTPSSNDDRDMAIIHAYRLSEWFEQALASANPAGQASFCARPGGGGTLTAISLMRGGLRRFRQAASPQIGRTERLGGDRVYSLGLKHLLGIVRVNSILPARLPGQAGAPLFLLTSYRRARPDSTLKTAYTYLP